MSKKSGDLNFKHDLLPPCNEKLLNCLAPNPDSAGQIISVKFHNTEHALKNILESLEDEMCVLFSPSPIAAKDANIIVGWNLTAPIVLIEIMLKELGVRFFFIEAVPLFLEHHPMQRISGLKILSLRYKCSFIFLINSEKTPHKWMLDLACVQHIDLA